MRRPTFQLTRILPLFVCILLAVLTCRVYFQPGMPSTHDGENHLARFANYKLAVKEGQFPPRFAPNLYHRYGYPVFNYNYPLANIASLPFSVIKVPYIFTFKLLVTLSVLGLLYGFWCWLQQLGFHWRAKFVAVSSVAVSPYLLQSIIYRGNIGEVMAMAGLVWLLWWVESLKAQLHVNRWPQRLVSRTTFIGSMFFGLFFLSHNVTVLFGTPIVLLYGLWRHWGSKQQLITLLTAFLVGLGLSLWFWLPALLEQQYVIVSGSDLARQYQQHFPTVSQLVSAANEFGYSYPGSVDSLAFATGTVQWTAILFATGWLFISILQPKRIPTKQRSLLVVFLLAVVCSLLLQVSVSTPVWEVLPLVRYIQFPWRLAMFSTLGAGVLIAWLTQRGLRWQMLILTTVLLLQVLLAARMQPIGYFNKPAIEHDLFEQSTTTSNENLPVTFRFDQFANWQPTAAILEGQGLVEVKRWTGSQREYVVTAETPVTVVEPTMNFPGWYTDIKQDNILKHVSYTDNELIGGRIAYQLEPGQYQVTTTFTQWTAPRIVGNAIAVFTILGLVLIPAMMKVLHARKKHVGE